MLKIVIGDPIKGIGKQSLFIYFDFSYELLEKVKSIPNRIYLPDKKCWEVSTLVLDKVKQVFADVPYAVYGELKKESIIDYTYNFKTQPKQHQLDCIQYGLQNDKFLLGDEMGLGKSKEVLDLACIRKDRGEVKRVLIVCGINNLKYNWVEEVEKHTQEKCWILGQRKKKRSNKFSIGSNQDKIEDLKNVPDDYLFLITNIESFRNGNFSFEVQKQCTEDKIQMLIIDEAHTMRNPSAAQTKGLINIKAKYQIAMSGTFLLNRPLDLYSSLYWIGLYNKSYWAFKNSFTFVDAWGNPCGVRNLDLLRKLISASMLRRLKNEVLDLPDKEYRVELVEMNSKQESIYEEVMEGLRQDIDKIRLYPNPLNAMLRARQATGSTSILSTTVNESAKLDRLEELLDEIISNGYKCLVFSNWVQMVNCALERIKQYNPAIITGEYNDNFIEDQKAKFHKDPTCKLAIGTIGKMGTGLTFNEANYVIFLDSPWTKGVKEQAVDRCHRIGQTRNVTVITLVTKNTIDEKIEQIIEGKGAMADMLIDGKITNNNRVVDFLLG